MPIARPPSASAPRGSLRQLPNAGTRPATTALATETMAANAATRQSVCSVASPSCSVSTLGIRRPVSGASHAVSRRPDAQPQAPSTRLSESSWRTCRAGVAPSAARTANSRRRVTACASDSVLTFTQAISSRHATIVVSARSGASCVPRTFSRIVIISML
jgi:hypothetical protein